MMTVEGYKMFHGELRITPKNPVIAPFSEYGDFLFRPDTGCWYGNGRSFLAGICEVIEA